MVQPKIQCVEAKQRISNVLNETDIDREGIRYNIEVYLKLIFSLQVIYKHNKCIYICVCLRVLTHISKPSILITFFWKISIDHAYKYKPVPPVNFRFTKREVWPHLSRVQHIMV